MTISHHPPEDLLADYATGALDEAEQLVVGVHVADCPRCRRFVRAIERLAGAAKVEKTEGLNPALLGSTDITSN